MPSTVPAAGVPLADRTLRAALGEAGPLGSTVLQLAARLRSDPDRIIGSLERLAGRSEVVRMGRGLWVLREFEELGDRDGFLTPEAVAEEFERAEGVALGTYRGPITFTDTQDRPIHRWWPYVQGYSAEFVRGVLESADLPEGAGVLDPFAGSGTTLVEARRHGYRAFGVELLPPAALAARVKTRFELPPRALVGAYRRWIEQARRRPAGTLPFLRETHRQFSARTLRDLTRLRDALPSSDRPESEALRLLFGSVLIPSSRLHRSPCLGYRRRAVDGPGPFARVEAGVRAMTEDLESFARARRRWGPPATVLEEDARRAVLPKGRIGLAITSPPYVNGMDYVMNYKLDLAWLGYASSYADLAELRRREVACDNLPRSDPGLQRAIRTDLDPWLPAILQAIRGNLARKGSYRRDDMDAIVQRYFADLLPVVENVHRALKPRARWVVVVGDSLLAGAYVPGDLLFARLARSRGFRIVAVEVARQRRSGQRRSFALRESVVTLEWADG